MKYSCNRIYFILFNFAVLVIFICFNVNLILNPEYLTGFSYPESENRYCQNMKENQSYIEKIMCKNHIKKEKFIWVFLDGLAYDQLTILNNRELLKTPHFYKIATDAYRQSGSLHDTYLTGKFSRNFPAKEIKIDHIFKQTLNANHNIYFRGTNFPLYFLLGEKESKILKNIQLTGPDTYPFQNICSDSPFFIPDNKVPSQYINEDSEVIDVEIFKKYLIESNNYITPVDAITRCFQRNGVVLDYLNKKSLIYYTMEADHLNHSSHKFAPFTLINVHAMELAIISLTYWINENPEYALIVSSDHGGQSYNGEDNICNHGCMTPGNEAVLFIYTAELKIKDNNDQIIETQIAGIEDVAPTVTQILNNVNIPLETAGFPLKISLDKEIYLSSLKAKEVQLIEFINKYEGTSNNLFKIRDDLLNSEYYKFIESIKTNDDVKNIKDFDHYINNYKNFLQIQQNNIHIVTKDLAKTLSTTIILFIVILLLIYKIYFCFNL